MNPLLDRATLRLAVRYAALFLASVGVLTFGILVYMDSSGGGDYLKDIGLTDHRPSDEQARKAADAVQDRLEHGLLLVNGLLVLTIPVVSYRMARAALKPIQENLDAQQQFVDNASHELKTPLSIINGELQLAVAKIRPAEDYERAIRTTLLEVNNLIDLTHNLTQLARNDTGAVRNNFEVVDLDTVVESCVNSSQITAGKNRVSIKYQGRKSAQVRGDRSLLRQMLYNLLDNAIKYSPEGSSVVVSLRRDDTAWKLVVRDSGGGMTQPELKLAAKRFWRSDKARSTPGKGLGLAISSDIARLHNGKLTLKAAAGKGLEATVSLPSAKA